MYCTHNYVDALFYIILYVQVGITNASFFHPNQVASNVESTDKLPLSANCYMYLAYDNMCNVNRLKVARAALPLPPPMDKAWLNIEKIIDTFHLPNHVNPECHTLYSPQRLKEKCPDANTQAGEQTFVWLGRFKHILCAMNKQHHLFYLHRMVRRRNAYTVKCYKAGKKPILPRSKL